MKARGVAEESITYLIFEKPDTSAIRAILSRIFGQITDIFFGLIGIPPYVWALGTACLGLNVLREALFNTFILGSGPWIISITVSGVFQMNIRCIAVYENHYGLPKLRHSLVLAT